MKVHRANPADVAKRTERSGWLFQTLFLAESLFWGRWAYWDAVRMNGDIGSAPEFSIPQIPFCGTLQGTDLYAPALAALDISLGPGGADAVRSELESPSGAFKRVAAALRECYQVGDELRECVRWFLWGFGDPSVPEKPKLRPESEAALYAVPLQCFLANPGDWGARIAADYYQGGKRATAWFATPLSLATMIAKMTFPDGGDSRAKTVLDPAGGTGVMLLAASNYSLRLFSCDIDPVMVDLCRFNAWLFVPWMAQPASWLRGLDGSGDAVLFPVVSKQLEPVQA